MKPLPLTGRTLITGFDRANPRVLIRACSAESTPSNEADAALVRSPDECRVAASLGHRWALAVGDDIEGLEKFRRVVRLGDGYGWLSVGDIVAVEPATGRYRVLWRRNSPHNAFLVTDRCDHLCLMCSQPPKDVQDGWIIDEIRECLELMPKETEYIGFTGGEPFLDWHRFIPLVRAAQDRLPDASVHVLTNGRAFARREVVDAWSALEKSRACVGIPIYSAVGAVHDHIVQSRNALDETVLGILRLKDEGNRVEIRVVLHRLTVERLVQTCEWLARNLPFVDHVALMGMEDTGFALANHQALWIDPVDYGDALSRAVAVLASANARVSIYNLPLCVLPEAVRSFAVRSISDWKNAHPEVCSPCTEREHCAGFFTTGRTKMSRGIAPIISTQ